MRSHLIFCVFFFFRQDKRTIPLMLSKSTTLGKSCSVSELLFFPLHSVDETRANS